MTKWPWKNYCKTNDNIDQIANELLPIEQMTTEQITVIVQMSNCL